MSLIPYPGGTPTAAGPLSVVARFPGPEIQSGGKSYGWFALTTVGDTALGTVCHTDAQVCLACSYDLIQRLTVVARRLAVAFSPLLAVCSRRWHSYHHCRPGSFISSYEGRLFTDRHSDP